MSRRFDLWASGVDNALSALAGIWWLSFKVVRSSFYTQSQGCLFYLYDKELIMIKG